VGSRGSVGGYLGRAYAVLKGVIEEPAGSRQMPLLGYQDVDDLTELINRPIQTDPPPGDFHIGLIYEPPLTGAMPARPGRIESTTG